jgi:peptide/nickel transport system permease protein
MTSAHAPTPMPSTAVAAAPAVAARPAVWRKSLRNPSVLIGGAIVLIMALIGLFAPMLDTIDPTAISPATRNKTPGFERVIRANNGTEVKYVYRMGTDSLGRDVYSRVIYGARVSLIIGVTVAALSIAVGLLIGMVAGYVRSLDGVIMRIMDGFMAIPAILLAMGLVSLSRAGVIAVVVAIVIPEIPRVVRLVRSIVLSIREEPYVEAAITVGTPTPQLLWRHVLPNTIAPLIVQGTFICASAILVEAVLSFLGIGIPPETPTWGNIMAEGRSLFRIYPHNILYPGIFLAVTVLAINMLGDGLRDTLDPRFAKRTGA